MEPIDFLKFKIDEQLIKIRTRIIYSFLLILAPTLLLIVNILSWTNQIIGNPLSLIVLIFFVISGLLFWTIQTFVKNIIAYLILQKVEQHVRDHDFSKLVRTKSYFFVFNEYYKEINYKIQQLIGHDIFCHSKNRQTLKFLNIKYVVFDVLLLGLIVGCFIAQWQLKTTTWHWELILSIVVLGLFLIVLLPFLIIRQIVLNWQIKKYQANQIDEYTYTFKYNFLIIKTMKAKLEKIIPESVTCSLDE